MNNDHFHQDNEGLWWIFKYFNEWISCKNNQSITMNIEYLHANNDF